MNYQAIAKKTMIMKREIQERLKKYGYNQPLVETPSPPLHLEELWIVSVDPIAATAAKRGLDLIKDSLLNRRPQSIRRFCPVCGHWPIGIKKKTVVVQAQRLQSIAALAKRTISCSQDRWRQQLSPFYCFHKLLTFLRRRKSTSGQNSFFMVGR